MEVFLCVRVLWPLRVTVLGRPSMHYVLVISSLTAGGAERVLTNLANRWVGQGHRVSIIPFKRLPAFYPLDERVSCVWLPESQSPKFRSLFFLLKAIMFRYHVWRLKPDRVLSFLDKTNLLTLFMLWGQGVPVMVSERIDPRMHYLHAFWRWLRRKLYPTASRVIVQTPSIASYFECPTVVIANPVQPAQAQALVRSRGTNWVSVGRLDPQKDHMTLIRAVHLLVGRHPDIKLTIYGEGLERERLEKAVKDAQLENNIFFPGLIANVKDALLDSDIFIFSSLYEGFSNALCEAMAHGVPVIASNIPGNNDVIDDGVNGRLFPPGDAEALANMCEHVMEDQSLRKAWGVLGVERMKAYDPEIIGKAWDEAML